MKAIGQPNLANPKSFLSSYETCLAALLALEDPIEGFQIGHLSILGGLTKLRELRGSFVWTSRETSERLGEREVEWFVNHLPALRFAMFINQKKHRVSSHRATPSPRVEGPCQLFGEQEAWSLCPIR